ncbi:PocR ligand-binding domain-containing protein [Labilibacter marinus]|uniref:PocR ligand-binding domain-containing protein n=1 Tax=Labilibacter marinus TaxID=1477105 RepID=UPI00082E5728|nr:PocR ligand-binding domain-containing protein [Labilibacter marinus]
MDNHNWKNIVDESLEPVFLVEKESGLIKYANQSAKQVFPQLIKTGKASIYLEELNVFNGQPYNKHVLDVIKPLQPGQCNECDIELNGKMVDCILEYTTEDPIVIFKINTIQGDSISRKENASFKFLELMNCMIEGVNELAFHKYDHLIAESLAQIAKFFKCERAYIFNYSDDEQFVSMKQQWAQKGVIPFSEWKDIPLVHFSHVGGHLLHNKAYCINTMMDIPDSAIAERNGMMTEGVKSVLLVSFKEKNHTLGFVGIDMVSKERSWTADEIEQLSLFSSLIGNIQVKQRSDLRKNFQDSIANLLFEESTWAIAIFKDEILVDCNNQTLALVKGKKHEVLGKSIYDLSYAKDINVELVERKLKDLISRSVQGENPVSEWDVRAMDGSVERVELTFQTFEFDGVMYLAVSAKDIKDQMQRHEELLKKQKSLESKLDVILSPKQKISKVKLLDLLNKEQLSKLAKAFSDATGLASAILDKDGNQITSVLTNNEVCELFRSTKKGLEVCKLSDEMLNTRLQESLQPEWQHCLSCSFLDAAAPIVVNNELVGSWWIGRALPHDADINRVMKFGNELGLKSEDLSTAFNQQKRIGRKEFESSLHLLRVLANELSNLAYNNLKLAKAIKAHQRMENRLAKAKEKAEESDQLKSAFLANMSHEIRTPMNGIVGFTELIQGPELAPEDRDSYISIIQESSNQLLHIINDIIDISKIEAGQIEANYEAFSLKDLLEELSLFYGGIAQQKGICLKVESPLADDVFLKSDRIKLKQVLSNLIGNAVKFTSKGCVAFGCQYQVENEFKFFVKDSGIGISNKDQKQIFNRFWQVGRNSQGGGGTGLGLTITKAYVELLGGKIWLESELEKGTRFSFTILSK